MKRSQLPSILVIVAPLTALVGLALVWTALIAAEGVVGSWGEWRMSRRAVSESERVAERLRQESQMADSLTIVAQTQRERRWPDLTSVKEMIVEHHLKLTNVEQVTRGTKGLFGKTYLITVSGSVGSQARLLQGLEEGFITDIPSVQLFPANSSGDLVTMRFTVRVAE